MEAGPFTHLSEEPIVDEVDHKDLQHEEKDDYCHQGFQDIVIKTLSLAPSWHPDRQLGWGVEWPICGFLTLPL